MFKIKEKKYVASLVAVVVAVVAASLLPPQILRIIIDNYLMKGVAEGLLMMGLIYLGSFAVIGLFDFIKGYLLNVVGQKIVRNIRHEMEAKLTRLSAGYFTSNSSGYITSKFINDVDNISELFTDGVISMAIDCFKITGIIISIWTFNVRLGVFSLCLVPVIWLITAFFRKRMLVSQQDNLKQLGKVNNHISESIRSIIMIKTFNREAYMKNRYESYLEENYITMNKVNFYDSCYSPIIQVITACSVGFVLYLSIGGEGNVLGISIGAVTASINLITNLFSPIDNLGTELQSIQKGVSGIRSVKDFMAEKEEERDYCAIDIHDNSVHFEFDHVSFGYECDKEIISDLNMTIEKGENIAFVGRTGAGKSTLFKLIAGILRPVSGRILVNGVETYRIPPEQRRKLFGYVGQQFSFIKGSVKDQITLGDETISMKDVRRAVEFVGMKDYVEAFDDGYDTIVTPDMFSQGQRQLMAIARAVVSDPVVLMLDEVTANLDSGTEERVVEVLKRAGDGKTILSIAHRRSTIDSASRIIEIKTETKETNYEF